MKLYLCPANQVFKNMALSAMDYYYETSILSISGAGQSAFGDNYFDIPTTQIEVEIDDAEYIEIMAADRDHTLGMWWQLGAIITDDNDVRLFIGLIKNDSLKHTPTDNRFGFEVLDLLGSMILSSDKVERPYEPNFERVNTDGEPVTFFMPSDAVNIQAVLENNFDKLEEYLESYIGTGALSGIVYDTVIPLDRQPLYFTEDGEMTSVSGVTLFDLPYYNEYTPFHQWSIPPSGYLMKLADRFMISASVRYRKGDGDYYWGNTLKTAMELRFYRRTYQDGQIHVYAAQFDSLCPLSCLGVMKTVISYSGTNHNRAMQDIKTKLNNVFRNNVNSSDIINTIVDYYGSDDSDDVIINGYTSDYQTQVYSFIRYSEAPAFATYKYQISLGQAPLGNASTPDVSIRLTGKASPISNIVESQNLVNPAKNIREITIITNTTIQARCNAIILNKSLSVNDITEDEIITTIPDNIVSSLSINGVNFTFQGVNIDNSILFSPPKSSFYGKDDNVISNTMDYTYKAAFNAYNVKLLADLIGYHEFTAGQAISYQGKYYRVFAWEYDESSGTTSIDAYGRK